MNGGKSLITALAAVGVGSALMYWFDPDAGKRRRAQTRSSARRAAVKFQRAVDTASRSMEKVSGMDWGDVARALIPITAKALLWR